MKSSWRRPTKTTALVAVTFSLFIGIFAYAKFGSLDTASRALEVGEEGFTLTPTDFEINNLDPAKPINRFQVVNNATDCSGGVCPDPFIVQPCADDADSSCAETVVSPKMLERGMVLDFSTLNNRGAWIESVDLDLYSSSANECYEVNDPDCTNESASFLDGSALETALLACPSLPGNPGRISDANPTVDDDSDPATDSRFDGDGPFTCSNGDFVVVKNNPADTPLRPLTYGTGYRLTPQNTAAAASTGTYTTTFADGAKVEMVTCVVRNEFQLNNPDYFGLSASLEYGAYSSRRPGVPMPQMLTTQFASGNQTTPSCTNLLDPDPIFESGNNTVNGFAWVEGGDHDDIFTAADQGFVDFALDGGMTTRTNLRFVLIMNPDTPQQRSKAMFLDDNSNYEFANLPDADYRLWAISGDGFGQGVDPFTGTDPNIDSDLTPFDGSVDPSTRGWVSYADFSLSGGQTLTLWGGFDWGMG